MMKDSPRVIRDLIARTHPTRLQNILMRIPDKVCAAGLSTLGEEARARLYALVAETKAARIREEMRLEGRRRTSPAARARLIRSFLAYFDAGAARAPHVWIRPLRRRDR